MPGLLALFMVLALAQTGQLDTLESLLYQQTLAHFAPASPSGQISVLLLTDTKGASLYPDLERLLAQTQQARAVALLLPLNETPNHFVREQLAALLDRPELGQTELELLLTLEQTLAHERALAHQMQINGNVILAALQTDERHADTPTLTPTTQWNWQDGQALLQNLATLLPSSITPKPQHTHKLAWPLESLQRAAATIGVHHPAAAHNYPAMLKDAQHAYPSILLQLLQLQHGVLIDAQLQLPPQAGIRIGAQDYATDGAYRFYPRVGLAEENLHLVAHDTLAAWLARDHSPEQLRDRIILVGSHDERDKLLRLALATDALLQHHTVRIPPWASWAQFTALLLLTILLSLILPRLRFVTVTVTVLLLALLLLNSEFLLLLLHWQWLPLGLPLMVLLLGYVLLGLRAFLIRNNARLQNELDTANCQLGQLLQNQGALEQALEKYSRCPLDTDLLERLYHLGLDFERKRQFHKAISAFEQIEARVRNYRDVAEHIGRNRQMSERILLANAGASTPTGTVIMSAEGLQAPTLGHYHIERELGRGAMGLVYLAKDPRIGRQVAIKTMALGSEFEGEQLEEFRARFYREAKTAGRLNHPNIVHIYDVGEEHDLAYIAMDYLQGEHLGHYSKTGQLLPIKEVLAVIEQVAEALAYAHRMNVVHRDIKPSNIIYEREQGKVRVTDFGVACMTDVSKTRTGTILGSPSYMSPEQVAGQRVDGRADIFSLGVTMYQLLTGQLPFDADSLASLMYKIANTAHPKPSRFRRGLPSCTTRIINKCLQKNPADRYADASDLANALRRCQGK
jgi:serine/threonine-protein kinase